MKRKELEEFKKRWEENLGGLGEMLNSPWFAVSIKYDEAEKNKCCIKLGQYVLRYWAQLHGVDLSPYGDKEITTDEFKQAVTKAQTEMKTDFEGGEGNAENNILDQLKRRLNIILFGTTKPEEDQKIKLGKKNLLSASNVVFFDELLKTDVGDLKMIIDDREIGNITGAQKKHVHIEYEEHNKRKKQEIELDDYYKEMIVRGLRSLEKNEWIKTSLKRTAQSRLDSLYPPETPDEVEEDSYLTECGGWIVFNELDLELRLCEKHFPRANLVNRETYDKILEALVECNEKVIDCVSELCEIDCKMNGTNIEDTGAMTIRLGNVIENNGVNSVYDGYILASDGTAYNVRVNAPNGYYQPGNTYDDLNPVLIKLGYTNSLGVYVEENFAYLLAPDCSYADLEELSNLANEAIGAQMKYPNDVNNMYRNTYNAYPLSKVWNFYTRSWS